MTASAVKGDSVHVVRVAVPAPLFQAFDYDWLLAEQPQAGIRVRVDFGRRAVVGVIVAVDPDDPVDRRKPVREALDATPLLDDDARALIAWTARYFACPLGEAYAIALPVALRRGRAADWQPPRVWALTDAGEQQRSSARLGHRQQAVMDALADGPLAESTLREAADADTAVLRRLADRDWIAPSEDRGQARPSPVDLHPGQSAAVATITADLNAFRPTLIDGVTGSGKTEVYLAAAAAVLARGGQCLLLVPEIALVTQLAARTRQRLGCTVAVMHSGLADGERADQWLAARAGHADVVIGTRSAVFTPLPRLGLIVVDEEHDGSYKQEDGCRYSARSVAIWRAAHHAIPVLLGSATPSLESLHAVAQQRFQRVHLPERAGAANMPVIGMVDVCGRQLAHGLSEPAITAIDEHLTAGAQVLVFMNRRGYAPTVLCHRCGWVAQCSRCDAHLTLHRSRHKLCCHHCGLEAEPPTRCPDCGDNEFVGAGAGTERLEHALARRFAGYPILRIDRDTTRRVGALDAALAQAESGEARLLVGTQMLAKGHHFPKLTLVVIVDADQGLFSADYRAAERMAQLVMQVAGRAGRAEAPGRVLIQTHHPDHPLLGALALGDYARFARSLLAERAETGLPPVSHHVLLRAEAESREAPAAFLHAAAAVARTHFPAGVDVWDPVPAPMERRAGRYRAQLLIEAAQRSQLQGPMQDWIAALTALTQARRVRWSVDVDPQSML